MMSNNKILTVSYGTFSCTLEGFEDSFGTMKAIAEYFRDLAADDRYFGAEPPQPDAEMLARIAQKEVSRRVEAREHEGKIVLSAHEEQPQAPSVATPAAAVAATALLSDADQTTPAQPNAPAQVADNAPIVEVEEPEAKAPAAKVEDAVAGSIGDEAHSDDAPEASEAEVAEDRPAETPAPVAAESDDENDIVPGQPDADVEAFFANSPAAPDDADEFEEMGDDQAQSLDAAPVSKGESIADKLQRIRAVVAQHDDQEDEDDYLEDEHAEGDEVSSDLAASLSDDVEAEEDADVMAGLDEDEGAGDDVSVQPDEAAGAETAPSMDAPVAAMDEQAEDTVEEEDDIAAILTRLDQAETDETDAFEDEDEDVAEEAADEEDSMLESLQEDDGTAESDAPSEDEATETPEDLAETEDADELDDAQSSEEAAELPEDNDVVDEAPAAPRARVIKVKRADLEAAIASGELEEIDDEDDQRLGLDDLAPARTESTSLSAEDEDELARELAELEAEIEMDQTSATEPKGATDLRADTLTSAMTLSQDMRAEDDVTLEDDQDEDPDAEGENLFAEDADSDDLSEDDALAGSGRNALPSLDAEQGSDMSRLMAEADHQMDEPESATRRDAFAHLRAAVAAKKADEALGKGADDDQSDDAYRNDLADVVQPRRPDIGQTRTARPGAGRPAPLKLVAEQRIDTDGSAAKGPVRPRRVASVVEATGAAEADDDSFAEFAEEMGATSLPQLLEAAAAYLSFVEGREQFSRPQLMTKVRQVGPEEGFSREDGLRHFGQLLRAGKIEKIKGGRFTVSEDIGFRPDQREAS